jgi:nucleoside-diphosphate-sugar epimerase
VWRGIGEGLNAAVVNPSVVLGPGQWERGTGRMFGIVNNGLKFYPPSATGFVDVRDVVNCMIQLMESDIHGQRFIINAENRSMRDVFFMIAMALGKRPPVFKAGRPAVELALAYERLRSFAGKYPRYTRALARNSRTSYEYDNSKVMQTLGFRFRELDDTIGWVANEFRQSRKMAVGSTQ